MDLGFRVWKQHLLPLNARREMLQVRLNLKALLGAQDFTPYGRPRTEGGGAWAWTVAELRCSHGAKRQRSAGCRCHVGGGHRG